MEMLYISMSQLVWLMIGIAIVSAGASAMLLAHLMLRRINKARAQDKPEVRATVTLYDMKTDNFVESTNFFDLLTALDYISQKQSKYDITLRVTAANGKRVNLTLVNL